MQSRRLIKLPAVCEKTGKRKSSIYKEIREDRFPRPVSIGPGAVAWVESEIDQWIAARIDERDEPQDVKALRRAGGRTPQSPA